MKKAHDIMTKAEYIMTKAHGMITKKLIAKLQKDIT